MDSIGEAPIGGKSGVGVLDKAVGILSLLAEDGPASLAGVVRGTGLARPTAYRLLTALESHGLVAREDGRYSLGGRLLSWGGGAIGSGLVEVSRPILAALRDRTEESTQLYVREGDRRVCVASVERTGGGLRDAVPEGAVLPLEQGSGGRVLLAWSEDGPGTRDFAETRAQGWAESVAEREVGVASVSAPVFGPDGKLRAAVCASGPVSRLGEHPGERLAEKVVAAAREIEAQIR
jgi:DNA-binding IclR family transcriptional regulator